MPHILFKTNNPIIKTPIKINGVLFDFVAKSYSFDKKRDIEHKICVTSENKEFLLTLKQKNDSWLLKTDKSTRITPISIVKNAINIYVNSLNAQIEFSNINEYTKTKLENQNSYLKDIDFFVNEFTTTKQLEIEIGFGSGIHLLYQAQKNPNTQYIGLEVHTPSIEQLLKHIELKNIKNILLINYDARLFMEFLKSNSVNKIFVHFPVPWEKKPHRRIYSNEFINEALRVLRIGGKVELRTDSKEYFDFCLSLLTNLNKAKLEVDINKDIEVTSKYENRWKNQNKSIYDIVLHSLEKSHQTEKKASFLFENKINFEKLKDILQNSTIVNDNFFIHFEDVFILNEPNSGLIKLTLGSFNKPLSIYLQIKDRKVSYFQNKPIPTSANINAHNKIEEILK